MSKTRQKAKAKRVFNYYAEDNGRGWVRCFNGKPELFTKDLVEYLSKFDGTKFVKVRVTYEIVK